MAVDPKAWRAFLGISEEHAAALAAERAEQRRRFDAIAVAAVVDRLVCELETTIAVVVPSAKVEREVAEVREEYRRSKAMTALRRRLRKDGIWSTGHEVDLRSALLTCDGDAAAAHWYLMHDASAPGW